MINAIVGAGLKVGSISREAGAGRIGVRDAGDQDHPARDSGFTKAKA